MANLCCMLNLPFLHEIGMGSSYFPQSFHHWDRIALISPQKSSPKDRESKVITLTKCRLTKHQTKGQKGAAGGFRPTAAFFHAQHVMYCPISMGTEKAVVGGLLLHWTNGVALTSCFSPFGHRRVAVHKSTPGNHIGAPRKSLHWDCGALFNTQV